MLKGLKNIIFVIGLTISFAACNGGRECFITLEGSMLGTTYHVKAKMRPSNASMLESRIENLDTKMKSEMSIFDPNSLISRINRNEADMLTPWLEQNIRLADSISRLSGGVYDITVAPLVVAYGFGRKERVEEPNIDSLMAFVGYQGIAIREGRISKRDPRMQIDLNSIAKGFAVDRMADIVEELGAQNYMVDIGGELLTKGLNPSGEGWRVGVESPIDGNMSEGELLERRIQIEPNSSLRAVATSGNYRRFYLNDEGDKIVHTIDPSTGLATPSTLLSVTVLASTCAEADAYATMLMAAGDSRAEQIAQRIANCEVYFIYNNARAREEGTPYREYLSQGMRERLLD